LAERQSAGAFRRQYRLLWCHKDPSICNRESASAPNFGSNAVAHLGVVFTERQKRQENRAANARAHFFFFEISNKRFSDFLLRHAMSVPPLIDARKAACELEKLRLLSARLNRELFEQCCQLQHDARSVDLELLASLSGRAREAERRKRVLEDLLDLQANFAAVASQKQ